MTFGLPKSWVSEQKQLSVVFAKRLTKIRSKQSRACEAIECDYIFGRAMKNPIPATKSVIVVDTISATITSFFAFLGVKTEILASFFLKSAIPRAYRQEALIHLPCLFLRLGKASSRLHFPWILASREFLFSFSGVLFHSE